MTKKINLGKGIFATVDDDDYEWLNKSKWYLSKGKYAHSRTHGYMHRLIMNAPRGKQVDHINGNGLDNRRANLRLCTNAQNHRNRQPIGGSSEYKGVYWDKTANKWNAGIWLGKRKNLGYFVNEKDAALTYDEAARKFFGAFARTNF
jgi:hypothetical protein